MRPDAGADFPEDEAVFAPDGHLTEGGAHAFVDGALGDADAARAIAHVAACGACAGLVAEARGLAAASTRILGALDDVPAGVVPAPVTAPATGLASAPEAPVVPLGTRAAGAARRRSAWAGWPVRAAAGLVLAAGLGSVVWRGRAESRAESAAFAPLAADTAAVAAAGTAAAAAGAPVVAPSAAQPTVAPADAATAPSGGAVALGGARPPADARQPASSEAGRERPARGRFAAPPGALQVATLDSVAAAVDVAPPPPAAEPAPLPPPPPPPAAMTAPAPSADRMLDARARARRAAVAGAAAAPDAASPDSAAPRAAGGCYVLSGAPPLEDGAAAPVRVTLEPDGEVLPRPESLTARWTARDDSLALVWRRGKGRRAPRAELRLGPEGADGVRRGVARGFGGEERPASARPVRCDGGLR